MKRINKFFLILSLLFIIPIYALADDGYIINNYKVNIDVNENNSYNITEVIEVDFAEQKHGIFRVLPLRFDKGFVKVSNISVPDFDFTIQKDSNEVKIRIGSADTLVQGKVKYTISYTYDVGADDLPDMDEFNHNIIGTQWETMIASVNFTINMPKAFDAEKVNCTSGAYGSNNNELVEWKVEGNTIKGRSLEPLYRYQGLTVALPLPEGYWVDAVKHKKPGSTLFFLLGYPLYALCIGLCFLLWFKFGKDTKLFPSVQFEAPSGLNPAEIGYIVDGQVDGKDVTSLILYWADKGYLEIEESVGGFLKGKVLTIRKLQEIPSSAKSYERKVFNDLFAMGDGEEVSTLELTNSFYKTVQWAQDSIELSFTGNAEKKIFVSPNKGSFLTALLAFLPTTLAVFEGLKSAGFPFSILGIPFSIALLIFSRQLAVEITANRKKSKAAMFGFSFGILFALIFVLSFGSSGGEMSLLQLLLAGLSTVVCSFFLGIISKRTEYGDKILEKILGFQEFINTAEKDKLEMMFEQNPSYFYNVLPYAMVMGLSSKWAKHFEGMALEPPHWYRGSGYSTFNAVVFTSALNNSFNSLNSAMTSSPSSSGSSGSSSSGGFSGGGSGGGGGGSW